MKNLKRTKIPHQIKRHLVEETGGKCANPGCSNWRTHIHHIKHWAAFQTHDQSQMVAICPTCHDAVHHGKLKITDETLLSWKGIKRTKIEQTSQIYAEPHQNIKITLGDMQVMTSNNYAKIFEMANSNQIGFRILDGDILQVSAKLVDLDGRQILNVTDNIVRAPNRQDSNISSYPGRFLVEVPATCTFIPEWFVGQVSQHQQNFVQLGMVTAFDLEVVGPGHVKLNGCWADHNVGVVISEKGFTVCHKSRGGPVSLVAEDANTTIHYAGPASSPIFSFR